MKIPAPFVALILFGFALLQPALAAPEPPSQSGDPGWPRERQRDGNRLLVYQPQVDDWKEFRDLTWRMAISLTPKGGKEALGVVEMKGTTTIDNENKLVIITDPTVIGIHFPSLDQSQTEKIGEVFKSFVPPTISISLYRLIASVPKQESNGGVQVNNDPPKIFVAYKPSVLLQVDGEPALADVPQTKLKFVVNTQWPLFFDGTNYYLAAGQQWLSANSLDGQWAPTTKLPPEMNAVARDKEWSALKKIIPPPAKADAAATAVFYSDKPADIILFNGNPAFSAIPETQLTYATNTDSVVFAYTPTKQFYYLTAGRWFRADSLEGPWTFATPDLPADFANIPASSPASMVLASVPGTDEAKDAVLLAQVPTTLTVNPTEAQAKVKVDYAGDPKFESIEGTSMAYATNTRDKVIKVGDVYYLCLQGLWFLSPNPQGPWTTATSIPQEIYSISPKSPVYNVTYVKQTTTPQGYVQSSYTAGYLGAFVLGAATGAIIANGSGYWYPPYVYRPPYGYPVYYPWAGTYGIYAYHYATPYYNSATGAYGWGASAYGPYGSAKAAAGYNPYTGTYARGGSVTTPYGSRTAAQAYNPYTGTYAQTRQGSSPTAQWGSSYVSRGNQSAYAQHYSNANGTVGSIQTSAGGKAAGASTAWGNTAVGKTASGNMYAGHDGNVYKNTGDGWEKYDNGSWNPVEKPSTNNSQANGRQNSANTASATESQRTAQNQTNRSNANGSQRSRENSQTQDLQRESQNRARGTQQSQRFQQFQRSGAGRTGANNANKEEGRRGGRGRR